jgi:DNA-binding NtrC family response regulator
MLPVAVRTENNIPRFAPLTPGEIVPGEPVIFVVDDEAGVRRFISVLLRRLTSAVVVESGSPETALAIARKMNRPIDLLISDIDLSASMNGIGLARELRALNPSMKVLLISGSEHSETEIPCGWEFLAKPLHIDRFLKYVTTLSHLIARPADYFG